MYCEIQTGDLYADMGDDLDLYVVYDTSNFSSDHPQYSESNHRILGKFKSETGSIPLTEFVGLRAKMYSLLALKKSFTKVKGVQKHYVRKNVRHQNFVDVLRNVTQSTSCKYSSFTLTNHVVNTVEISKLSVRFRRQAVHTGRRRAHSGIRTLFRIQSERWGARSPSSPLSPHEREREG